MIQFCYVSLNGANMTLTSHVKKKNWPKSQAAHSGVRETTSSSSHQNLQPTEVQTFNVIINKYVFFFPLTRAHPSTSRSYQCDLTEGEEEALNHCRMEGAIELSQGTLLRVQFLRVWIPSWDYVMVNANALSPLTPSPNSPYGLCCKATLNELDWLLAYVWWWWWVDA